MLEIQRPFFFRLSLIKWTLLLSKPSFLLKFLKEFPSYRVIPPWFVPIHKTPSLSLQIVLIQLLFNSGSLLLVNTTKSTDEIHSLHNYKGKKNVKIGTVDLFKISKDIGLLNSEKQPVVNTSILGALIAMEPELGITINNLSESIKNRFGDNPKSQLNIKAAKLAFDSVSVMEV